MGKKSSLDHITSRSVVEYRLKDDGNCYLHLFCIERKRMYNKQAVWFPTNNKIYTDWREAYNDMKQMAA